jgi:hypothetical protein
MSAPSGDASSLIVREIRCWLDLIRILDDGLAEPAGLEVDGKPERRHRDGQATREEHELGRRRGQRKQLEEFITTSLELIPQARCHRPAWRLESETTILRLKANAAPVSFGK